MHKALVALLGCFFNRSLSFSLSLSLSLSFGWSQLFWNPPDQAMSSHHSGHLSQVAKVSRAALLLHFSTRTSSDVKSSWYHWCAVQNIVFSDVWDLRGHWDERSAGSRGKLASHFWQVSSSLSAGQHFDLKLNLEKITTWWNRSQQWKWIYMIMLIMITNWSDKQTKMKGQWWLHRLQRVPHCYSSERKCFLLL